MSIHKHAISDPKPDITEKESLADYREAWVSAATWPETDEERVDYQDWAVAVMDGNTILGFRDWLKDI